jgi:hypothetical protein
MKYLPDGSRAPTEEKKTDSFEESELSADGSHYPWNNKDLGDLGAGGNNTKKYITGSTRPTEKLDPSTSRRAGIPRSELLTIIGFKVRGSEDFEDFFRVGRAFKVLWSEPAGTQEPSRLCVEKRPSIHEGKTYSPIRRFLIVTRNRQRTCL